MSSYHYCPGEMYEYEGGRREGRLVGNYCNWTGLKLSLEIRAGQEGRQRTAPSQPSTPLMQTQRRKMQSDAALGRCRDRAGGGREGEGAVNTDWVGLWTKTGYFNNIDQQYSCLLRDQARPGPSWKVLRILRPGGQRSLLMMISGRQSLQSLTSTHPSPSH